MTTDPSKPPFSSHGRYYLLLKLAVLVLVVVLAVRYGLSLQTAP